MRRTYRSWGLAALIAVMAVVSVPAAFGATKPLRLVYEYKTGDLTPGTVGAFNEHCPRATPYGISGFFGAAVSSAYGHLALAGSGPLRRGWSEGVLDLAVTQERALGGGICSSRRVAYRSDAINLSPAQSGGYTVRCPRRYPKPISGISFAADGDQGAVIVTESAPNRHAWATVLENQTGHVQRYVVGVTCAATSARVSYLTTPAETVSPHGLGGGYGHCSGRTPHAISGLFYPATPPAQGDLAMTVSLPSPNERGWRSSVLNLTDQPQRVVVGAVCVG